MASPTSRKTLSMPVFDKLHILSMWMSGMLLHDYRFICLSEVLYEQDEARITQHTEDITWKT
jgi:hypothetical protein